MKHLLLASSLLLSSTVFAADWTPAFRYLEAGKSGDDGVMLNEIMYNTFSKSFYQSLENNTNPPKQPLTKMALTGKFLKIKIPYRNDVMPAKIKRSSDEYGRISLTVTYPLKNATLYGYPLESFTVIPPSCVDCDDLIDLYATFKPMSNAQFRQLTQKVVFEDHPCDGKVAKFYQTGKTVTLRTRGGC